MNLSGDIVEDWKPHGAHEGEEEMGGENEENDDLCGDECEDEEKKETEESEEDEKDEALKILKMRYARGEITREQFLRMKKDLEEE